MAGELELRVVNRQVGQLLGIVFGGKGAEAESMPITRVQRQTPEHVGTTHRRRRRSIESAARFERGTEVDNRLPDPES